MEIPSEKVPLAQKMMITKCNIAGKFVVTATQMLESMCGNPLPTRAEMTDVSNSIFDGTDCTMLSGETANGIDPANACATMAAIAANAEQGVNAYHRFKFIRNQTPKPLGPLESVCSSCVRTQIDMGAALIVVFSSVMGPVAALAKYKPSVPVLVVTDSRSVASHCHGFAGLHAMVMEVASAKDCFLQALSDAEKLGYISFSKGRADQVLVFSDENGEIISTPSTRTCFRVVSHFDLACLLPSSDSIPSLHSLRESADPLRRRRYEQTANADLSTTDGINVRRWHMSLTRPRNLLARLERTPLRAYSGRRASSSL